MLRYMLDTNTCIVALKADATSRIAGRFNRYAEQLCTSSIVLAELYYGAENSRRVPENLRQIEMFAARLEAVLDFYAPAAAEYGRVRSSLRRKPVCSYCIGTPITTRT